MGGPEAIARQHERGTADGARTAQRARRRRTALEEQAPIAGETERDENGEGRSPSIPPTTCSRSLARIDGRPVVVGGEDFTQRGGSPSPAGLRRSVYAETLAIELRRPLVRFLEGGGGSVAGTRGPTARPPRRPEADGRPGLLDVSASSRSPRSCSSCPSPPRPSARSRASRPRGSPPRTSRS